MSGSDFAQELAAGLSKAQKTLPCRYFYDRRGSELFERITALEAYYPTRCEIEILRAHAGEIAQATPPGAWLVEFGSGSSLKTEILLDALRAPGGYVAIDVSESALAQAQSRFAQTRPGLALVAVAADFGPGFVFPDAARAAMGQAPRLGFFPGSTIGNFAPAQAQALLAHFARLLGPGARLVVGADLRKDEPVLLRAYDDPQGVTGAFNLNLLARANSELGADFDLEGFAHEARWNAQEGRVEMHLRSLRPQVARAAGRTFFFRTGETIHTESAYKWRLEDFAALAAGAGWRARAVWRDAQGWFSVHDLAREP